ncbi:MAG: cysteine peptidase family C39 domain-containing protein [Chloroflexota bacterium]
MPYTEVCFGKLLFGFDCGAKALQLVMAYYGLDIREDELIGELNCDVVHGVPPQRMIAVAEAKGFRVVAKCDFSLEEVKQVVDKNQPVIVLVQAWAERYMTLDDWKDDKDDGHYVIVIGHNGSIIVFEDPSSFRRTWLTEEEFLARWHDTEPVTKEKLDRFAMVLLGKEPASKVIEHMG